MRKVLLAASAAAFALAATPAFAQDNVTSFTGPRVGVVVGTGGNNVIDFDEQTIGIDAGYDFDLGNAVFGVGAEYQTDLGRDFFDVNETALLARVGAKVGNNALVYATGGYTRIGSGARPFARNGDDGYRIGAGVEFAPGNGRTYMKLEQRYFDYGGGFDGYQTVAGVGVRFGAPAAAPIIPAAAPPPPPATQTCPDGSVVLATEYCPASPPPPPPPPPPVMPSGERG